MGIAGVGGKLTKASWPGKSAKRVFALDVPAIHVSTKLRHSKPWMPGTRPGMTVEMFVLVLMDLVAWH